VPRDRRAFATPESYAAHAPAAYRRSDLIALYSRRSLESAHRRGELLRLLPGIYVASRYAHDFRARCDAALLWATDQAALASTSAAFLHGLRVRQPREVTIALNRDTHLRAPTWIRVLRWSVPPDFTTTRGIRCVSVADAVVQSWIHLPDDEGVSLVLDAVRAQRVTAGALADRAAAYPRIRRRTALTRLLDDLDAGPESYLEYVAATRVFRPREFSTLRPQVTVSVGGRRYRLDFFDAEAKVAVELDGRLFHGDDVARRRDIARDADLAALGITTIRLTFEDVTGRPEWCRNRVRRALRARAALRRRAS